MCNAKEELLDDLPKDVKVLCGIIKHNDNEYLLPVNYTESEFNNFLNSLDFEYDDGYGCQELFGTIWFEDGTWLERGEYDGAEWWKHISRPSIPDKLLNGTENA